VYASLEGVVTLKSSSRAARLEAILDSAVDAIIAIGKDGMMEFTNLAAERLFQHSVEEFIGKNLHVGNLLVWQRIRRCISTRSPGS
jgi:PAS domain S-box-containing protein